MTHESPSIYLLIFLLLYNINFQVLGNHKSQRLSRSNRATQEDMTAEEFFARAKHIAYKPDKRDPLPTLYHKSTYRRRAIEKYFRQESLFPYCHAVMTTLRRQYKCGSCWAVAAASTMTDRICIELKGNLDFIASAQDLISCQRPDGCMNGYISEAFDFWQKEGIVSGGELHSQIGCLPYSNQTANGNPMPCTKKCSNPNYTNPYQEDKIFAKIVYQVPKSEEQIQHEIMAHGAVAASIAVFSDFKAYEGGLYNYQWGKFEGGHAVKIVGWTEMDGEKCWILYNTWKKSWGEEGQGYWPRGKNYCGIEGNVRTGRITPLKEVREYLVPGFGQTSTGSSYRTSGIPFIGSVLIVLYAT